MQVFWFERWNFADCRCRRPVDVSASPVALHNDTRCINLIDNTGRRATMVAPESRATSSSIPVPTNGASALNKRHRLAHHVRAHQARFASSFSRNGIRPSNRYQLFRRHIDEIDIFRRTCEIATYPATDQVFDKLTLFIKLGVRLRNRVTALFIADSRQLLSLTLPYDLTIRRFDKAVLD